VVGKSSQQNKCKNSLANFTGNEDVVRGPHKTLKSWLKVAYNVTRFTGTRKSEGDGQGFRGKSGVPKKTLLDSRTKNACTGGGDKTTRRGVGISAVVPPVQHALEPSQGPGKKGENPNEGNFDTRTELYGKAFKDFT